MSNDSAIARVFKLWAKISMMILDGKRDATTVANVLQVVLDEQPAHKWPRKWREEDGVIYFSVTSDGTSGVDWITRLENKGLLVGDYAKQVLRTPSFKPTNGVTTEVAVLKGILFKDQSRITSKIRTEADKRKLQTPNAELACLIREKFTDKEIEQMGLRDIIAMHEPINDPGGVPGLLDTGRGGFGCSFGPYGGHPGDWWSHVGGFAFAVAQTQG